MTRHGTLEAVWPALQSVTLSVVPQAATLDDRGWAEMRSIMESALEAREPWLGRQLRLFARALGWLPLLVYGRPLERLDASRRHRFLERVQDSPFALLRRGFWGLRTLVLMGYYGRATAAAEIGYRADVRGWELRQ